MRSLVISPGVLCALLCSCVVFPAFANPVPCPEFCRVTGSADPTGLLIAPGPMTGTSITVSVRSCSNIPMAGASVNVVFSSGIRVCTSAQHTCTTGSDGVCGIQLRGGGCARNTVGAGVVWANGIEIRHFSNIKSPDNAAHTQSQADGAVSVVDLAFFADEFQGTVAPACHDYDNDNDCDVADLGYFGDPFKAGLYCALR